MPSAKSVSFTIQYLPDHLQSLILARRPVVDICRCLAVCVAWSSLVDEVLTMRASLLGVARPCKTLHALRAQERLLCWRRNPGCTATVANLFPFAGVREIGNNLVAHSEGGFVAINNSVYLHTVVLSGPAACLMEPRIVSLHEQKVNTVAYSAECGRIAVGLDYERVIVFDQDGLNAFMIDSEVRQHVSIMAACGDSLYYGGGFSVYRASMTSAPHTVRHSFDQLTSFVMTMAVDGGLLAFGGASHITLVRTETDARRTVLELPREHRITGLCVDSGVLVAGSNMASSSPDLVMESEVRVWSATTVELLVIVRCLPYCINSLSLRDGLLAVSGQKVHAGVGSASGDVLALWSVDGGASKVLLTKAAQLDGTGGASVAIGTDGHIGVTSAIGPQVLRVFRPVPQLYDEL